MEKNKLIKNIVIGFFLTLFIINISATSHLPLALLNLENQTNEYLNMTSYLILPIYSLFSIINPLYLILGLIYLSFSLLYFKKKSHHILFLSSFILSNTLTYFFQSGLISILMIKYNSVVIFMGLSFLLISSILTYILGFIKIKEIYIKILCISSGIGFGLFFFQIPDKISIALRFALSYNSYFARFLFTFKILYFIILSLVPMIILIQLINNKKYSWTLKIHDFFSKNKEIIIYLLTTILFIIFILSYVFRKTIIA